MVRETPWLKRVMKLSDPLMHLSRDLVKDLTDDDLAQLAKDLQKPNEYNCYWYVFDTRKLLAEAVRNEQAHRHNQKERSR